MTALTVTNVSKAYKRYPNKWARALEWIAGGERHKKNWVLQDINFFINRGEAVGIVGINGAGKSTLLKIITGTTQPTNGEVVRHGRIAALLELGMGFHPDFTGRQNVMMAGQLLGMSADEIGRCMGAIEAFAEIGDYIDRPVRLYSSGMQMRLAFSVATAVRPDVLVVDEALSVGDAYFQHKSFEKIRQFRTEGTTLLIVSHDRSAIQALCDRALLLEKGFIVKDGRPEEVMDFYNAIIAEKENSTLTLTQLQDGRTQTRSGTGEATLASIQLLNDAGDNVEHLDVGQSVTLRIKVNAHSGIDNLVLGYGIKDRLGLLMYGTNTKLKQREIKNISPGTVVQYDIRFFANLGVGSYSIHTALSSSDSHLIDNYEWRELALMFHVVNLKKTEFAGCAWLDPEIDIQVEQKPTGSSYTLRRPDVLQKSE